MTVVGSPVGWWRERAKKEKKREKSHGCGQQCGDCQGEKGRRKVEEGIVR